MIQSVDQRPLRVALHTLGCKLNQAETELLAENIGRAGHQVVASDAQADIYVLNTCTVTHVADRKARHLLRLARRRYPDALIVATGCYARRAPSQLEDKGIADVVLPHPDAPDFLDRIALSSVSRFSPPTSHLSYPRTRSFIKVQDGCHDGCAYCVVPQVRGRERSLPPEDVIARINARVAQGCKEVVLTGSKIGGYRWGDLDLGSLVERVLRETAIERLRLTSLQPQELTPGLLALWAHPRLCRHIHMPLQSGSDSVLASMRRRYLSGDFLKAIGAIREAAPDMAVTADVMVGFPGESESDFRATLDVCQQAGLAAAHIFPYSPRPGTRASQMETQVDDRVKRERAVAMQQLARQSASTYRERFLGATRPVLWEEESAPGLWSGLTDNYLRVLGRAPSVGTSLANQVCPVRLASLSGGALLGEIAV